MKFIDWRNYLYVDDVLLIIRWQFILELFNLSYKSSLPDK